MMGKANLVSAGARMIARNKRYLIWFYVLNLVLAWFGAAGLVTHMRAILDHSLYADRLLHGFDLTVLVEMLARPEMGPAGSWTAPSLSAALVFCGLSFIFMPGVLSGYAAEEKLPRDDFFRACGRNLWRFLRLLIFYLIFALVLTGTVVALQAGLVKAADKSSHEKLPFYIQLAGWSIVFLLITAVRAWFDVAQADIVLSDQNRVRTSIGVSFRKLRQQLVRLLGSYVSVAILALIVLSAGLGIWHWLVPPASVWAAFLVGQLTLLVLLAMRFWQRALAVAFQLRYMHVPIDQQPAPSVPSAVVPVAYP